MAEEKRGPKRPAMTFNENYFISAQGHVRDRIIINENLTTPKEGFFISLNGFAFLAKPGMEIDLPRPVRKMLDTLIETQTFYDENGVEHTRDIKRITYTLIKEGVNLPDLDEIATSNSDQQGQAATM